MKKIFLKLYYRLLIKRQTTILFEYNEIIFIDNESDFVNGILNKHLTIKPFK